MKWFKRMFCKIKKFKFNLLKLIFDYVVCYLLCYYVLFYIYSRNLFLLFVLLVFRLFFMVMVEVEVLREINDDEGVVVLMIFFFYVFKCFI